VIPGSGSQPFMVCGPLPKTLNTCGPLLTNRILQYHHRAIKQRPLLVVPGEPLRGPQGGPEGLDWETLP